MEYIEKRIVVEDVDECTGWFAHFADPEPGLLRRSESVDTYSMRTNVPLELGLTTTAPERRNRHVMGSVQAVGGPSLLTI